MVYLSAMNEVSNSSFGTSLVGVTVMYNHLKILGGTFSVKPSVSRQS